MHAFTHFLKQVNNRALLFAHHHIKRNLARAAIKPNATTFGSRTPLHLNEQERKTTTLVNNPSLSNAHTHTTHTTTKILTQQHKNNTTNNKMSEAEIDKKQFWKRATALHADWLNGGKAWGGKSDAGRWCSTVLLWW
jgi:hypothetical protein